MQLNLLDEWVTEHAEMPPRSRLYSRTPHGHGTALQESQISYLVNLAKAHTLTPRLLIEQEIIPCGHIQYDARESFNFYSYYTRTINFQSKYAEEVAAALDRLTGQTCLTQNTFLPWKDVLDPRGGGLLDRCPRWCPICLTERQKAELEPYFPLLWYVMLVENCPLHGCRLESECPHCHRKQTFIPKHYHIDHCTHCGAWLGGASQEVKLEPTDPFVQYAVGAISEMIQHNASASTYANFPRLQERVRDYVRLVGGGSITGLGKKVGLQGTVINQWLLRERRPQIKSLLQFTHHLGTTPVRLLRDEIPKDLPDLPDQEIQARYRTQRNLLQEDKASIEAKLQAYLDRDELPPTIEQISFELGQTISFLKYRFRTLCRLITDKRRQMYEEVKMALEREIEERSYELTIALLKSGRRASRRLIENTLRAHKMSIRNPVSRAGVTRAKEEFFSAPDEPKT